MGRTPKHRLFYHIGTVDGRGRIEIPIALMEQIKWMQDLVKKRQSIDVTVVMFDSLTLHIEPRKYPVKDQISAEEKKGKGSDTQLFLPIRLCDSTVRYKPPVGGSSEKYRLTIPAEQKPWLAIEHNHGQLCVLLENSLVQLWSMERARKAFSPLEDL